MTSYTRMRSNYRKLRTYNKYSHPLSLLFLDVIILSLKAVALLCLAWLVYKLGVGLIGNSRMGAPAVVQSSSEVSLDISAPQTTARSTTVKQILRERQMQSAPQSEKLPNDRVQVTEPLAFGSLAQDALQNSQVPSLPIAAAEDDSQSVAVDSVEENDADGNSGAGQSSEALAALEGNALRSKALSIIASGEAYQNESTANQRGVKEPAPDEVIAAVQGPDTESLASNLTFVEGGFAMVDIAQLQGEIWVHEQQPSSYTVQYGTSTSLPLIEGFQALFPSGKNSILFQFANTNSDQEAVYGVLHGVYGTVAEALAGIEQMPDEIRNYKPWVRRMDQIQSVVYRAQ